MALTTSSLARKLGIGFRNLPNLLQGYNIYVNRDKLRLIDLTFTQLSPGAKSFADLGGVWKVNGAYAVHTIKKFRVERGVLVDTNYPAKVSSELEQYATLQVLQGDFADPAIVEKVGKVDVVFLFDVLLHQANPDWDEVLARYAAQCSCFLIYNQQFVRGEETLRLTDLPFEKYIELASDHAGEFTRYVYDHADQIHPEHKKPWKDIHNITQWGITDRGLREAMARLGFKEVFYRNYGTFIDLPAFENHAFVFVRG